MPRVQGRHSSEHTWHQRGRHTWLNSAILSRSLCVFLQPYSGTYHLSAENNTGPTRTRATVTQSHLTMSDTCWTWTPPGRVSWSHSPISWSLSHRHSISKATCGVRFKVVAWDGRTPGGWQAPMMLPMEQLIQSPPAHTRCQLPPLSPYPRHTALTTRRLNPVPQNFLC